VETVWQKLISELYAIERMDRIVRASEPNNETDLIGLSVREMRRLDILRDLVALDHCPGVRPPPRRKWKLAMPSKKNVTVRTESLKVR
jgi:hypothetical protein